VDLNDVVNMALMKCPKIKIVGIAAPGVTLSGVLTLPSRDIDHVDVAGYLKNLHPGLSFVLDNDVNAVACGLYAIQTDVQTLSFLMLPRNVARGGIGSVVKGHLIRGYHHIAGEVSYLPLKLSGEGDELAKSEQGSLEIVAKTLVSLISILGPEEIFYYAPNVPEVDEVHGAMSQLIPDEYIPPIKKIGNLKEYVLFGELMNVVMRSENKK
jgi:predicted NBD/HSP70 family sugar kinase